MQVRRQSQPPVSQDSRDPALPIDKVSLLLTTAFLMAGGRRSPRPLKPPRQWKLWQRVRFGLRNFKAAYPVTTGVLIGLTLSYVAYPFAADLFLPLYTDIVKPNLAGLLHYVGIPYPSFTGDNAVSPYQNLQNTQTFIRESAEREENMLRLLQNLKPCRDDGKNTQLPAPPPEEEVP